MQRIRFGLNQDGERGWHVRNALGESTFGPLGLLTLLETQLGLARSAPSQAERIVQMRECLLAVCTGKRFFERSFEADQIGTAAILLDWRDQWYLYGWQGTVTGDSPPRLLDMAAVETLARSKVFPCVGQRLNEVVIALTRRRPQIESVELLDAEDELPAAWRSVLAHLPATSANRELRPAAKEGTILRDLQNALIQMQTKQQVETIQWRDDGSVRIVRAEAKISSAQWMASQVRGSPVADRVLIVEQNGIALDAALAAMNQPLLGISEPSAFRPALQLLPLVMRLIWEPLDFKALMQFLTHPLGPVDSFARRLLAEKMASTPGIGGEAWQRVLHKIEEHYGAKGAGVLADIEFWLEQPRFTAAERAPLEFIAHRVERLAELFRNGMAQEDVVLRTAWVAGYHQTASFIQVLKSLRQQGMQRIAPEALDRLASLATASGSDNPSLHAQAGTHYRVRSPGAVIETFDEVCWWNMAAVLTAHPYPWSPREMQHLRTLGVELPDMSAVLARQAREWLCPILAARHRLTLTLPQAGEEPHPAWLILASLIELPDIQQVEDLLKDSATSHTRPVAHRPLPMLRRWWQIPAGSIHGWERSASFSSLEQFFFNPYQWALNYPAALKSSALLSLPGDFQLLGTLAHRVVERLYRQPDALSWPAERVQQWFDGAVEQIVREEGAVLLMSGRRADLEAFRLRFRRSLATLHENLKRAGTRQVEPEKVLEGDTPLGSLRGSSDLLITLSDGRQAIIDMKWAGNKKYRSRLKDQTHIQLAIYARLVERNTDVWPAVGYFILRSPELLTTSTDVFPGVSPISVAGTSTALLWNRVTATWQWRRQQIEAGAIEVVMEHTEPTDSSTPPNGSLLIEPLDARYNPFVHLAGWTGEA